MERFSDSLRHVTQHTLKEQEQENERIQSENLNLKLRVQYLEDLLGENSDSAPSYWDLQSALSRERERIIEEAAREVSERDELLAAAKSAQDDLRLENTNLVSRVEQLEREISDLNQLFQSKDEEQRLQHEKTLEREIENARAIEREAVEKQYAYAQQIERDTHEKEISDLKERWQQWHDSEVDRITADAVSKHGVQLDSLYAEVNRLQSIMNENAQRQQEQLSSNETSYKSLEDQFAKQSKDLRILQELLDERVQAIDRLKEEIHSLECSNQALDESMAKRDAEISVLKSENKKLQSTLDICLTNEEEYKFICEKNAVEGVELKAELQGVKIKLSESEKLVMDLNHKLAQLQVDKEAVSKLEVEAEARQSRVLELEQNLIESEGQRQEIARELNIKNQNLIEKEAEVAELTNELKIIEQKLRSESNTATCAQEKLLAEIQLLRMSMQENEIEKERDLKVDETNGLLRHHGVQDGRSQQVESLKKKVKQLDSLLDMERVKVSSLRDEIHKVQRDAEWRLEEAQLESKDRISKVYEQLKLKTLECARLQSEIKMLKEEWNGALDNVGNLNTTEKDYGTLVQENFHLRKEMEILQRSLSDTREAAQQALRERESALKNYERRQKELHSSAHQQQATAERLMEDLRMQLDKAISSRDQAVADGREEREKLNQMNKSLQLRCLELEKELQSMRGKGCESGGLDVNQDPWRSLKQATETIRLLEKENERISSKYSILKEKTSQLYSERERANLKMEKLKQQAHDLNQKNSQIHAQLTHSENTWKREKDEIQREISQMSPVQNESAGMQRLRDCNRVLILELEDTRCRLLEEKKRRHEAENLSKCSRCGSSSKFSINGEVSKNASPPAQGPILSPAHPKSFHDSNSRNVSAQNLQVALTVKDMQQSPSVLNLPWSSADVLETSSQMHSPSPSKHPEGMDASALNLSGTTVRHLSQPLESPKLSTMISSLQDRLAREGQGDSGSLDDPNAIALASRHQQRDKRVKQQDLSARSRLPLTPITPGDVNRIHRW